MLTNIIQQNNKQMKKYLFLASCLLLLAVAVHAQRYAVIDSKYILEKLPEYKESQTKLNQFSALWQQEIETKQIYAGYLPAKQLKKAATWLLQYEEQTLKIFYELNPNLR